MSCVHHTGVFVVSCGRINVKMEMNYISLIRSGNSEDGDQNTLLYRVDCLS